MEIIYVVDPMKTNTRCLLGYIDRLVGPRRSTVVFLLRSPHIGGTGSVTRSIPELHGSVPEIRVPVRVSSLCVLVYGTSITRHYARHCVHNGSSPRGPRRAPVVRPFRRTVSTMDTTRDSYSFLLRFFFPHLPPKSGIPNVESPYSVVPHRTLQGTETSLI